MDSREKFERWAVQDALSVGVCLKIERNGDWYFERGPNTYLNTAWAAWKAGVESTKTSNDCHWSCQGCDTCGSKGHNSSWF